MIIWTPPDMETPENPNPGSMFHREGRFFIWSDGWREIGAREDVPIFVGEGRQERLAAWLETLKVRPIAELP